MKSGSVVFREMMLIKSVSEGATICFIANHLMFYLLHCHIWSKGKWIIKYSGVAKKKKRKLKNPVDFLEPDTKKNLGIINTD
jgi:hypothetical protein